MAVDQTERPANCQWHVPDEQQQRPGYMQWHSHAERSYKAGERQVQCMGCNRYFWSWERTNAKPTR